MEDIGNAQIACLMYELKESSKQNDILSIGFLRSIRVHGDKTFIIRRTEEKRQI